MNKAIELGLSGVNFWSWDYCRRSLPDLWETIAKFEWPGTTQPDKDITENLVIAINSKNLSSIIDLYQPDAVHLDSYQTIQGHSSLTRWYSDLLNTDLKDKTIQILESSGKDPSRQFTWIAKSASGEIINGNDTLGLIGNKIIYHFSSFTRNK